MIPPSLTSFAFYFGIGDPSSTLQHVSLQKLSTLSLSGCRDGLELLPNSLHLPLLKSFICKVSGAEMLIRAIVAPNVTHFTYHARSQRHCANAESICLSFPAVRHVDLDRDIMVSVFQPGNIPNPDYWPNLESLTGHEIDDRSMVFLDGLITWLDPKFFRILTRSLFFHFSSMLDVMRSIERCVQSVDFRL